MLKLRDYLLLRSGRRVIRTKALARKMLQDDYHIHPDDVVEPSLASKLYKHYKSIDLDANISIEKEDRPFYPVYTATKDDIIALGEVLLAKRDQDTPDTAHESRLNLEWDYFERQDGLGFLISVRKLIARFKQDNVVWGVGRGSSCASYILYLLEVHDINPITFSIDFSEFSKEKI